MPVVKEEPAEDRPLSTVPRSLQSNSFKALGLFLFKIKYLKVLVCLPSQNYTQHRRVAAIFQVMAKASLVKRELQIEEKTKKKND